MRQCDFPPNGPCWISLAYIFIAYRITYSLFIGLGNILKFINSVSISWFDIEVWFHQVSLCIFIWTTVDMAFLPLNADEFRIMNYIIDRGISSIVYYFFQINCLQ